MQHLFEQLKIEANMLLITEELYEQVKAVALFIRRLLSLMKTLSRQNLI